MSRLIEHIIAYRSYALIFFWLPFISCAQVPKSSAGNKCIKWGINGHPLTQHEYKNNWAEQVATLKKLQLDYYRIDVPISESGLPDKGFDRLTSLFSGSNVSLLPILLAPEVGNTPKEIYKNAYNQGASFFGKYGKNILVVEVGNEEDNTLILSGAYDGTVAHHYNLAKAEKVISKLRGLIDGMRSVQPNIKVIISLSWVHFYYLELLENNKVNYDIIGYHWYSDMGDITNVREPYGNVIEKVNSRYNKPVWITEFNYREGSLHNRVAEQTGYLKNSLQAILNQNSVLGFMIYELYDQPSFKASNPGESEYGLLKRLAVPGKVETKEAFTIYRSFIDKNKKQYCR